VNYQTYFVCFFLLLAVAMKLVAYFVEKYQKRKSDFRFVFLSPLFSTKSFHLLRDSKITRTSLFLKALAYGTLMTMYFLSCYQVRNDLSSISFSYLLTPGVYLLTLWMGSSLQLLFSVTGVFFVDIHDRPYLSFSVTDFWSKRWNRWIRDWLNNLTLSFKTRNLTLGIIISFFISGLFHEVMFNLPYYLYTQTLCFGNMMLFFMLQGIGILIEKKFLRQAPAIYRRIFMWLMIIGLSPLFIQRPLLSVIGIF
jgi:hypothetical protein